MPSGSLHGQPLSTWQLSGATLQGMLQGGFSRIALALVTSQSENASEVATQTIAVTIKQVNSAGDVVRVLAALRHLTGIKQLSLNAVLPNRIVVTALVDGGVDTLKQDVSQNLHLTFASADNVPLNNHTAILDWSGAL